MDSLASTSGAGSTASEAPTAPFSARPTAGADRLVSAVLIAIGAALWWESHYRAAQMPAWGPWDFSWGWYLAAAFGLWWYAAGLIRTPRGERPALWRTIAYVAGVATIYTVLQTHFEYLAEHMFFLNRVQHVAMHHLGPFLVALAWPGAVLKRGMPAFLRPLVEARPVLAVIRVVQQPILATLLFVGLVALWLIPPVHFRAMIDPRLYQVMNWSMVVDVAALLGAGARPAFQPAGAGFLRRPHRHDARRGAAAAHDRRHHRLLHPRHLQLLCLVRAHLSLDRRHLRPAARWSEHLDSAGNDERHRAAAGVERLPAARRTTGTGEDR